MGWKGVGDMKICKVEGSSGHVVAWVGVQRKRDLGTAQYK